MRVLALLGFVLATTAGQENEPASRVYAQASNSVFMIIVKSSDGKTVGQATGFSVAGNRIITNEHVVAGGTPYLDLGAVRVPLKVIRTDSVNDLAVLMPDGEISSPPLRLATTRPKPGTTVFALGNPEGLEKSISTGVVAGVRDFRGRELLQISAPLSPGSSGGPILTASGEVVGVAVGILEGGQNLNFAVPASMVHRLLSGEAGGQDFSSLLAKVTELAGKQMQETFATEPDSPYQRIGVEVETLLSTALETAGSDISELTAVADKALELGLPLAVKASERMVGLKQSSAAYLRLAQALYARYGMEAAEANPDHVLLKKAEVAIRSAFKATHQPTAEMYSTLADVLEARSLYAESRNAFSKFYDLAKSRGETKLVDNAVRGLSRTSYALNNTGEGDRWFQTLAESGRATAWDWDEQAKLLDVRKNYRGAGDSYIQAAQLLWFDWCRAASAYAMVAGAEDSTLRSSRECIKNCAGKENADGHLANAHFYIASILNDRGVYEEAVSHAREAIEIDSGNAFYQDELARSLFGLRRFQEAINASKQALRLSDGKYGYMHFHLGSAYFEVENSRAAIQSFQKASELDPKDTAAVYNIALCYTRLGYYRDAASWYEEVLRRNPNHKDKQDILNRIRVLRQ
jgi:tetratricopeptide (TPR) repeat protein